MTDTADLRRTLTGLHVQHLSGDLHERNYQRETAPVVLELCRLVVCEHLADLGEAEEVLAEHHVVQAHTKLTGAILKENVQEVISLYAARNRLVRLRLRLQDDQPISCDARDGATVDSVPYVAIRRLRHRGKTRGGEAAVGLGICAVALLSWPLLSVTGPALLLLGVLGILHALLLRTRWLEVEVCNHGAASAAARGEPICILGLRHRTARALVRQVRGRMTAART